MKKYLQIIMIAGFVMAIAAPASSQYYEQSAGIRLGGSSGITYKKFFVATEAIEFLLGGREDGVQLTGLYLFNRPLNISKNETFFLYYGAGGHIGYEKYPTKTIFTGFPGDPLGESYADNKSYLSMGVDAMVGLEFRFLTAPITLGLDIKPYFSFIGFRYTRTRFWDTSLSVKYVF